MTWRELTLYGVSTVGCLSGLVLIFSGCRSARKRPGFSLRQFAFKSVRARDCSGPQLVGEGICALLLAAMLFGIVYFRVFARGR
jgi:hypothetical protein